MNLFQIDEAIKGCVDQETGEIVDIELLGELMMERNAKIENVALWVKNLKAFVEAVDAQIAAFNARKEKAKKNIEKLEEWLAVACGGQKFATGACEVSFRKSTPLEVMDQALIPEKFMKTKVTTSTAPDKNAIKAAIKAGEEVPGCKLVEKFNTTVV